MNNSVTLANEMSKQIDEELVKAQKALKDRFMTDVKVYLTEFCVVCAASKKRCGTCLKKKSFPVWKDYNLDTAKAGNWYWQHSAIDDLRVQYQQYLANTLENVFAVGTKVMFENEEWVSLYNKSNKVLITKDNVDLVVSAHLLEENQSLDEKLPSFTDGTMKQKRYAKHNRCAALFFDSSEDNLKYLETQTSAVTIITKFKNKNKVGYDRLEARFKKASTV